jgi:hypothetical protein
VLARALDEPFTRGFRAAAWGRREGALCPTSQEAHQVRCRLSLARRRSRSRDRGDAIEKLGNRDEHDR